MTWMDNYVYSWGEEQPDLNNIPYLEILSYNIASSEYITTAIYAKPACYKKLSYTTHVIEIHSLFYRSVSIKS